MNICVKKCRRPALRADTAAFNDKLKTTERCGHHLHMVTTCRHSRMKLASVLPRWSSVRALGRRLRPLPDLDPVEAGPTPQAVLPAESAALEAARPFAELGGPAAWPVVGSAGTFVGADRTRMDLLFGRLRERYGDLYRFTQPLRSTETVVVFSSQDAEKV